jgi:hypothetical protein
VIVRWTLAGAPVAGAEFTVLGSLFDDDGSNAFTSGMSVPVGVKINGGRTIRLLARDGRISIRYKSTAGRVTIAVVEPVVSGDVFSAEIVEAPGA